MSFDDPQRPLDTMDAEDLIGHARAIAEERDDPLISELAEELERFVKFRQEFEAELKAQGLPEHATLSELIRHHRGNAGAAVAFQMLAENPE